MSDDEIIKPGASGPADLPPEVLKQMQQEAMIRMASAKTLAKAFVKRMEKEFLPHGASDFLSILAAATCDILAEALVTLDELKLHRIDKSVPLFTARLRREIEAQFEKAQDDKILIARNQPPSSN